MITLCTSIHDDVFSIFETNIRWIAGYLSAYELSGQNYPILVQKSQELTNKMAYAFVGVRHRIQFRYLIIIFLIF